MKKTSLLILFLLGNLVYSQEKSKEDRFFQFGYSGKLIVSGGVNTLPKDKDTEYISEEERKVSSRGFNYEAITLQGLKLTHRTTISAGLGVDWNSYKEFRTSYWLADIRVNLFSFPELEGPYVFAQGGNNIQWNSSFYGGTTVKLGFGYLFEESGSFQFFMELYARYRNIYSNGTFSTNHTIKTLGLSLGVQF